MRAKKITTKNKRKTVEEVLRSGTFDECMQIVLLYAAEHDGAVRSGVTDEQYKKILDKIDLLGDDERQTCVLWHVVHGPIYSVLQQQEEKLGLYRVSMWKAKYRLMMMNKICDTMGEVEKAVASGAEAEAECRLAETDLQGYTLEDRLTVRWESGKCVVWFGEYGEAISFLEDRLDFDSKAMYKLVEILKRNFLAMFEYYDSIGLGKYKPLNLIEQESVVRKEYPEECGIPGAYSKAKGDKWQTLFPRYERIKVSKKDVNAFIFLLDREAQKDLYC